MVKTEAIFLVWGVRDEVLEKLPVEGTWLYGEYDFIAKVEFESWAEMEEFERLVRSIIKGNTFKLLPVIASATKDGGSVAISESSEAIAGGVL